jgi:uncharacterized repeat protein (TIGR01451 family)
MLPVPLARLTIATTAEPDFSIGTFRSDPADVVDAGETIEWVLHVRNGGDGPARHVQIAIAQPDSLIYVPNSTTVNDVPVRDVGALAPFASERGIMLNDVDPGVEATVRWRDVVHNGLAAGEAIERTAYVRYDGERNDQLVSNQLKVRATPVFANAIPGLPFGLDGMVGGSGQRALTEDRFIELPPATPVGDSNGNGAHVLASMLYPALDSGDPDDDGAYDALPPNHTGTMLALTPERLTRTLRFLDEARFEGFVTHLFAIRSFLPETIGDAHGGALAALRDLLGEELDRLFIKSRGPGYTFSTRDIETPSLRTTIERALLEAGAARGLPSESPGAAVVLRGSFEPSVILDYAERVEHVELAVALPWAALARLLPDGTEQLAHYRSLLVARLDAFAQNDSAEEFIDALQHRRETALDAALDVVRTSLHATV